MKKEKAELKLTWFREHSGICFGALSFLLPVFVMLVCYNASGIHPFGKYEFLYMDTFYQYMPFFTAFRRAVRSGDGLFYTWYSGLGTNFWTLYGYYLASPINFLAVLVPEKYLNHFLAYTVVLKTGLAGFASYRYLFTRPQRMGESVDDLDEDTCIYRRTIALFFSMGYALCGFMMAYNWNVMWLDGVILLPIILLGLESLVLDGKPFVYCLALAASIYSNFYISIMICIFQVVYFVYLICQKPGKKAFRDFVLFSLLAGCLAGVMLIPEVYVLLGNSFSRMSSVAGTENYFSVLDVLARHCISVGAEHSLEHWPGIYCGVSVFLFVPLYVVNEKIPMRRRFGMLAVAGIMLLGFCNPLLDWIWHGLKYPQGLPARQAFAYCLLVVTMCHESAVNLDFQDKKQRGRVFFAYLLSVTFLLFVEKSVTTDWMTTTVIWLTLVFLTIYAVLIYKFFGAKKENERGMLLFLLICAMVLETQIDTVDINAVTMKYPEYNMEPESCRALYEWIVEQEDGGIYRMENISENMVNAGIQAGYSSASTFSSTHNLAVKDMYRQMGLSHSNVHYAFYGNTVFTAALLNVKYLYGITDSKEDSLYSIVHQTDDGIWLYRSNISLPFGYVAPMGYDLPREELEKSANGIRMQNEMVRELGIQEALFEICETEVSGDKIECEIKQDGIYYSVLLDNNIVTAKISGMGNRAENYYPLHEGSVMNVGYVSAGRRLKITNTDRDSGKTSISAEVYRLNEAVLEQAISRLSRQHLENVSYDSTHIRGNLKLEEAGRLILSVPYEKGWQVKVNGVQTEAETFCGGLMAFDLQPGEYVLEMKYVPYGFVPGLALSIVSLLVVALLWYFRKRCYFRNCQTNHNSEDK